MSRKTARDHSWLRRSFLVNADDLLPEDQLNRVTTRAMYKFTDTTPGGNLCINPPPQFTPNADPIVKGIFSGSTGMGRYYSEAIDDNNQIIHMRFGVPQFNSLTTFFSGFYNSEAGTLARTGRATGLFYTAGKAVGFVVSVFVWPILAMHLFGYLARTIFKKKKSKYYYLKPAMPLYWNAVTTIVNHLTVNMGIVGRVGSEKGKELYGDHFTVDQSYNETIYRRLPDVFDKNGGFDIYKVATRAQRLARHRRKQLEDNKNGDDPGAALKRILNERMTDAPSGRSLTQYIEQWSQNEAGKPPAETKPADGKTQTMDFSAEKFPDNNSDDPGVLENASRIWNSFWDSLKAELDDGAAFASFRVNPTGSISESFSNSVGDSEIAGKINGASAQARSTGFTFANGNVGDLGGLGTAIGAVAGAVKDVVSGIANSLELSGLAVLAGAAYADIPKHWQNSSASLPRSSYTIDLVSPYGNPISQLINIYIPFAMILAGGLPLSTGKQTYTSPFLVELYDQGRCQTRLGMIDNISVTRGTGNMGFNNDGKAMGIQVTFSVIDMSSILHMPISESTTFGIMDVFDEDTYFTDYMATLSGMTLNDQIYTWNKLKIAATKKLQHWDQWTSPAHFGQFVRDSALVRPLDIFFKGTDKI